MLGGLGDRRAVRRLSSAEQRALGHPRERGHDLVALGAHLAGERVVVEALEHRHERDRRDRRIEIGRRDLGDALVEHAREAHQHVGAEPAELVAPDLGFGPRADHRAVALVQVGELRDPRRSDSSPAGPGSSGPSDSASVCISSATSAASARNRSSLLAKYR